MTIYRDVSHSIDLPRMEHKILQFWKDTQAFQKRVALNAENPRWSFIDGPITANNPMGVHHAWGRTLKDLYQRYKALNGYNLRYQNGFDCQGLWVEVEVEKELDFKSKRDIEKYGIARFVNRCKERVLRYAATQVEQSIRLGYWMNWDNPLLLRELAAHIDNPEKVLTVQGCHGSVSDTVEQLVGHLGGSDLGGSYFTFSNENNYTIWSVLKKCHERGWLYRGRDVMPWCPRCSTALSQHEIATEGYRELTHPGVTLEFPIRQHTNESLLVWTTTPWTLTSNIAAAVHPDLTYLGVQWKGKILYLEEHAVDRIFDTTPVVTVSLKGSEMENWQYIGPFDEFPAGQQVNAADAHRVILWDEVSESEGTGIVHIAPGCGKEDFELSKQLKLPAIAPLDEYGVFLPGFDWLTGTHVYDSADAIIHNLKEKKLLVNVEEYAHRYPVCWRCSNELVFRLVNEWFIFMGQKINKPLSELTETEMTENLRYQIMASTQNVQWIPPYGLHQELDWLTNMDDWMISKKRYWGLALPIWVCPDCDAADVIGSHDELKQRAVQGWDDFEGHTPHRPWIDAVKISCPHCEGMMTRIKDVGNPWLDAGIVAFSTLNYRENRAFWKQWFPADLICESLQGQFRNWFYSMLTMSTILERVAPFTTCLGHGLVLAEDGREMHKSWGNAIWFDDAAETMGADAMRWIYCTNKAENNLLFGYGRADRVRREFIIPLWNIYSFFITYANIDAWTPRNHSTTVSILDQWILSKLNLLIQDVTANLEQYDAYVATAHLRQFIQELSTWYIRRSRRRFWKSESDEDKKAAYTTLYTTLETLIKLLAPFTPFLTEEIYQNLVRQIDPLAAESIHHSAWPKADLQLINHELMHDMDLTIQISHLGRAARNHARIKLRQPLAEAKIAGPATTLQRLHRSRELIQDELNVKKITFTSNKRELITYRIQLLPQILGKKHGALFPKIQACMAEQNHNDLAHQLQQGHNITLVIDEQEIFVLPTEVEIVSNSIDNWAISQNEEIVVGVNIQLTELLRQEGLARDVVRRIQNQRKNAEFDISDEITIYYIATPLLTSVFERFHAYIQSETLATALIEGPLPYDTYNETFNVGDQQLHIGLKITHP
ncbi:MAG: class I tRNA ligase family protein [Candidatus Bathyarchaeota archaeon]|nr:class I tRNA ligase family protein [Candidatus Bathyarchaeota archaeon]